MTDHESPPNAAMDSAPQPQMPPRRGRRYLTIAAILVAAGLAGAVAAQAFDHGFGRGGRHHHGMMGGFGGPIDPARAAERADRMVRHLAIEIDATAEQQEKLRGIVKAAVGDLLPMRETARSARERARTLLTQPTIDRAALEAFRVEQIALADQASKRLAQALADAAEVLTPEQRQHISEHLERRRSHRRGWRRGEHERPRRPDRG